MQLFSDWQIAVSVLRSDTHTHTRYRSHTFTGNYDSYYCEKFMTDNLRLYASPPFSHGVGMLNTANNDSRRTIILLAECNSRKWEWEWGIEQESERVTWWNGFHWIMYILWESFNDDSNITEQQVLDCVPIPIFVISYPLRSRKIIHFHSIQSITFCRIWLPAETIASSSDSRMVLWIAFNVCLWIHRKLLLGIFHEIPGTSCTLSLPSLHH